MIHVYKKNLINLKSKKVILVGFCDNVKGMIKIQSKFWQVGMNQRKGPKMGSDLDLTDSMEKAFKATSDNKTDSERWAIF